jgi:hypothetical protein
MMFSPHTKASPFRAKLLKLLLSDVRYPLFASRNLPREREVNALRAQAVVSAPLLSVGLR